MTDGRDDKELTGEIAVLQEELRSVQAERDRLREEVEIYENILNIAQGAISITRREDGVFRFVNDTFCRITGYRHEEVLGQKSSDLNLFANASERDRLVAAFRQQGRLENMEASYRAKDGCLLETVISAAAVKFRGEDCIMLSSTPITSLKKAERELLEKEEQYRLLVENANEGIVIIQDGLFRFTNKKAQQMMGYAGEELQDRPIADIIHPDDRDLVITRQRQRQRGEEQPAVYELRLVDPSGHILWVETRGVAMEWNGQPATLSMLADMTDRKQAEESIRQSEESYRSVMELAPDAITIASVTDGRYKQVNKAFCEMTGYTAEETRGRTVMDLKLYADPDDRQRMLETIRRYGKVEKIEVPFYDKYRNVIHGLLSARPIQFQGELCVMVMVTDITNLKRAQQDLQKSEATYRLLVENAFEGTYISRDGAMAFANTRMGEITGYGLEELKSIPFETLIHPEDRREVLAWLGQTEEGKETGAHSFRLVNRDQEIRWVELNAVPMTWEGDPAVLHFLRDMSLQKKMEGQLIQAGKMEALGTLAGGIAHNFNNMLMGIQGHISLMMLDMGSVYPNLEKFTQVEAIIRDAAVLTKELLGLARGGKFEVKATNLNQLLGASTSLFGRTKKEIHIHEFLEKNLWTVEVDRSQIEQVLLNLFVNASQAMPEGGDLHIVTDNVNLDDYYVKPYGIPPGRFVRVSITDTGMGMDRETLKRVFDPFFTTKDIGKGTGLGLASAYGIIRNHNGIINVYSEKGQGATFNIYLPASDKKILEESPHGDEILTGSETILLIDDEKMILQIGKEILERLGYQVLTASIGDEGVEIYNRMQNHIALVILDMVMPGQSGGDTFDRLQTANPEVKVLLSSGYSINGQAKKIMDRGCRGFIQKPYSVSDLSRKVREILDA